MEKSQCIFFLLFHFEDFRYCWAPDAKDRFLVFESAGIEMFRSISNRMDFIFVENNNVFFMSF